MFLLLIKRINKISVIQKTVFFNLYEKTSHTSRRIRYIYKNNAYTFFFLNDLNKYISVQGLIANTRKVSTGPRYYSLGGRIKFRTKIGNEYAIFHLPINLPGLHI